ncbi:MAG: glycosyltransferase family A protein [Acidobacteriota bacterium]
MSAPRVSVVIPAYKVTAYIGEALESVFAQSWRDFETIVVNDGCPDTEALERVLEPYLPRLVYIKQENRGLSGARNTGIRAARGEFIALLDGDDLWEPDFLRQQMAMFDADPGLDMVWCDSVIFGSTPWAGRRFSEMAPSRRPVTLKRLLTGKCVPVASCVVVRRQAVLDAGGFDEDLRRVEDFDMWLRLAWRGSRMDCRTAALGRRRDREGTLSSDARAQFETAIQVCRKFQGLIGAGHPLNAVIEAQVRRIRAAGEIKAARAHFDAGRLGEALEAYRRANQCRWTPRGSLTVLLLTVSPSLAGGARALKRAVQNWLGRARRRGWLRRGQD